MVEVGWDDSSEEQDDQPPVEDNAEFPTQDGGGELFFPLPANDEQRQIVDRLRHHKGVLVQGPPGTGKSHTIANLISHLLAHGKRVLVTSHTPRALRVLKEKIPTEVSDLCVVLLGHDHASFEELNRSVHGITHRLNTWDARKEKAKVQRLQKDLATLRARAARTDNELRAIREAETHRHPPMNGGYMGTLQAIAKRLRIEAEGLSWVREFAPDNQELPEAPTLTNEEAVELLEGIRSISVDRKAELELTLPSPADLPEPGRFDELVSRETQANESLAAAIGAVEEGGTPERLGADDEDLQELLTALDVVLVKNAELERHVLPFTTKLASDARSDQDQPWRVLLQQTRERAEAIEAYPEHVRELTVTGHDDVDLPTLREDARTILSHLKAGGRIKRWFRYTEPVCERAYIVEKVKAGGKSCRKADTLAALAGWADVRFHLQKLQSLWRGTIQIPEGDLDQQLAAFRDSCEPIEAAIELNQRIQEAKALFARVEGIPQPAWHDTKQVSHLRNQVASAILAREADARREELDSVTRILERTGIEPFAHPIARKLKCAVETRDGASYRLVLHELQQLLSDRLRIEILEELTCRLQVCLPKLADAMTTSASDAAWPPRLSQLRESWNWLRTDLWLQRQLDPLHFDRLLRERTNLQDEMRRTLTALTAARAWTNCMERMTSVHETYLKAWMQAVDMIGAGTGKRATRFRRVARECLERCRTAIPAWIMPLYRVVESVTPGEDLFDVAIIDEASQSGMDALFLHYIAKQIVVVGDDKQIAPTYVGSNRDEVELLRRRHIPDLPLTDFYDLENSLFSHASIRFGSRIRLREHFRCMPEIIQFSNNLCYRNDPLIPLRQYGAGRLEPVVSAVYVPEGYVSGGPTSPVNPEEAARIVEKIAELSQDPRYLGKTFGVISMLGEHQAREIERRLLRRIGPEEIERRRLVCGDAYAFQGDERNVMFLSLVVAPTEGKHFATLSGGQYERRFNVAASRAQDQLWLFHSVTLDMLPPRCLRRALLDYCLNPQIKQERLGDVHIDEIERLMASPDHPDVPPSPFESWFEVDVFLRIHKRGYRVIPQYDVAGYRIDLVVAGMKERIAVECDGERTHGPDRYEEDMVRQRQLERCGWVFWRIRGAAFYRSPDDALGPLWDFLTRHGVFAGARSQPVGSGDGGTPLVSPLTGEGTQKPERTVFAGDPSPREEPDRQIGVEPSKPVASKEKAEPIRTDELVEPAQVAGTPQGAPAFELRSPWARQAALFDERSDSFTCPDPQTGDPRDVRDSLVEVIGRYGPMPCHYAYRMYAQRAGVGRLSRIMRDALNRAVAAAVRSGTLRQENEYQTNDQLNQIVRIATSPTVVPRARGDRTLSDIPPSEIAAVMWEITHRSKVVGRLSQEAVFRPVLEHYDLQRLTAQATEILTAAYQIYWRIDSGA